MPSTIIRDIARRVLPSPLRRRLREWRRRRAVRFGDLRRVVPVSRWFGEDRGQPIDRYYIERFLQAHAADVRGRVLEVGDDGYTRRFGGDAVHRRDVLHVNPDNPRATIVADLALGEGIPVEAFDCIILTQTLQLVYDVASAVRVLHRSLVPGGVLLVTIPGISQIDRGEWGSSWYWSFTPLSARRLFEDHFPASALEIEVHGNVLSATAFLQGLASHELRPEELDACDPCYPVSILVRAVKAGAAG
jgi:SAM-dependent methyltransferase